MERTITRLAKTELAFGHLRRMMGAIDPRSLIAGVIGGAAFGLLAVLSLSLSRFDSALAAVWLPNACAVAFLLRARLGSEIPFIASVMLGSAISNIMVGTPVWMSLVFSLANIVDIAVIVWLTRRSCGRHPDMTDLSHLSWFVLAGGLVGPAVSACVAALALTQDSTGMWATIMGWFLTDSMAMVLVVPTALLIADAVKARPPIKQKVFAERAVLMVTGLIGVFLVFNQTGLPLLFLIPPITLLHAFRLGSLGTAIFVGLVAVMATVMTRMELGPIVLVGELGSIRLHVIQAFIAANFLTGLPVAAVLAGRERMMHEVEDGKRQLQLLAENITDAILRYDLNGECTYASSSVRDVMGEEPETFLGNRASDRMHEDARELISKAESRLLSGESTKERFTYRRFTDSDDGTPVFIEADCAVAFNPRTHQPEGIVVAARDVTERVELELLLTRARRHAENAAHAKSEFLANMSHEIRTPMNGVLGFAELMLGSDLDQEQRRHTKLIVESGRSMMLLLNDILDLSKIEAGQIAIDCSAVDLRTTIEDCASLHRPGAEKKRIELTCEFDPEDMPFVMTDGLRLRQILLNLIGNAVKFTESGDIRVTCLVKDRQFSVRVADSGIGISASRLESIFQPFTQAESDTSRRFGGTGLGLSISRQLAELLGGFIDVESEAGKGSCFTLTLPAVQAEPGQDLAPERPVDMPDQRSDGSGVNSEAGRPSDFLKPARILLAEDHDVNRLLATEMLQRCGQSVDIAHDGNEAIALVFDAMMRGAPYDLVLMDIQMPGCDGYAAARAIRDEGIGSQLLPIVALTANAFPEDIAAARDAGMQAHLAKPLVFAELAKVLQRWLPTRIVETEAGAEDHASGTALAFSRREQDRPDASREGRHSPQLVSRWNERRTEAIEAVRGALHANQLENSDDSEKPRNLLVQLLHKLAGTAAIFGEPELGEKAAALERALRMDMSSDVRQALAIEVLDIADGPDFDQVAVGGATL